MNLAQGERRASPRVPFFGQAVVRAAGRHVPCTTVDLSATGMLLLPAASARPGLGMRVAFKVEHYLGPVELQAVLTREGAYRGTYGWGVRFINVPDRVTSLLQLYVQQRVQGDRDQVATPALGVEKEESPDSGQYLKVSRRRRPESGDSADAASAAARLETTATQTGLGSDPGRGRYPRAESSGSYRKVYAQRTSAPQPTPPPHPRPTAKDPANSGSRRLAEAVRARQLEDTQRGVQAGKTGASSSPSGLSAPTGRGAPRGKGTGLSQSITGSYSSAGFRQSSPGAGRYSQVGPRRVSPSDPMAQTGPPRKGAVEGMHQTGPQRPIGAKRKGDEKRKSNPTPVEVRELYQAALSELMGDDGAKKRKARERDRTKTRTSGGKPRSPDRNPRRS